MNLLAQLWLELVSFADAGGPVIWLLMLASLALWSLILERIWFIRISWPPRGRALVSEWQAREDCQSWQARKIREAVVSEVSLALHNVLPLIQVLVALCPLLGLLGTVTGMIGVFDVIAVVGNDDAQAMAQGVYRATIPTMAGLVVALSGMYFIIRLRNLADNETSRLADRMPLRRASADGAGQ